VRELLEPGANLVNRTPLIRCTVSARTLLIIVVILLLIAALPAWPYSTAWGYYPSGGLGLILIVLIVLALL
jgi:hypothetical protein